MNRDNLLQATGNDSWNYEWATSLLESAYFFPPVYYLVSFIQLYIDLMMDRMVLALVAFLLGMTVMFGIESFVLYRLYKVSPILPPPVCEVKNVELPEILKSRITQPNLKQKEDCIWLNFILQFLFHELKDSLNTRRLITRKIQIEFEEILKSKSGVLMDELFLRDFHLGDKFPVIMAMSLENVDVKDNIIRTLDVKARLVYDGGLKIAIDVALPLTTTAYVSVKIVSIRGVVRLQFSTLPYTHWSVAFYEDPELELDITAQLDGRMMPKLKSIIANQIKKIIRKKHTLPMYKMRFKPFFPPHIDLAKEGARRLHLHGTEVGSGILEVTVVECSRLSFLAKDSKLYCVVSIDPMPLKQMMAQKRSFRKTITLELVKLNADSSFGLLLKDEIWEDRLLPVVIVDKVNVGSAAHLAGVQEGDFLVSANGMKITSAKQSTKHLKWAKDNRLKIQVERQTKNDRRMDFLGAARRTSSWHSQHLITKDTDKRGSSDLNVRLSTTAIKTSETSISNVRHTVYKDSVENPKWNQKFILSVDSSHHYLNICVWCMGGDRTDKPEVIKMSNHDVLIGYVSLNLDDIFLHCLMTLNGRLRDRYKLKHGHYKTEAELIKMWSIHKGWDPNQMYGDIQLDFCFHPYFLTQQQRRTLASCRVEAIRLQNDIFQKHAGTPAPEDNLDKKDAKNDVKQSHHQFDSANFTTATFCDYCGKKIWMKEAFKCKVCHMVCHRKCLAKCLVNTVCSEQGVQKKISLDQFEPWVPLNDPGKFKTMEDRRDSLVSDKTNETEEMDPGISDMNIDPKQLYEALYNLEIPTIKEDKDELPSQTGSRFTILKEQTERMKDNVLKHLKKNSKVTSAMSDKSIMNAKDAGAKLFADMDPILRRDKLDELVKNLDEQIKLEMNNKDSLEKQLASLEAADKKLTSSKTKSDMKAVQSKILKSGEKLDAMSLLMLQYCSALQICLSTLEVEEYFDERLSLAASPNISTGSPNPERKGTRSSVTGFVKRAGSTMKEKVVSLKDFGRKGKDKSGGSGTSQQSSNNNKNLLPETEDLVLVVGNKGAVKAEVDLILSQELNTLIEQPIRLVVGQSASPATMEVKEGTGEGVMGGAVGVDTGIPEAGDTDKAVKPVKSLDRKPSLTRSTSDSELEVVKLRNNSPEGILNYRGRSLPKFLFTDDSDSDSDFLVIDSTDDEPAISDSSDSEATAFALHAAWGHSVSKNNKEPATDNDSDEGDVQHSSSANL